MRYLIGHKCQNIRQIAAEFLPERGQLRSITLPFWVGGLIGLLGTGLGNLLDRAEPIIDPTWYGLLTISKNLDLSGEKLQALFAAEDGP